MTLFKRLFQPAASRPENVHHFLTALVHIAPPAGMGAYGFKKSGGGCHGFVQFIANSPISLNIHRIWTLDPGQGNGSFMLGKLCNLADHHGVELTLKALPFGRKPHPFTADELATWYQQYGFEGPRKKMIRRPRPEKRG